MKKMKSIIILISLILLSGCSNSKVENPENLINGYIVPPMPDKTLNDSTLFGVDIDNNGIRDDIDRFIAESYTEPAPRALAQLRSTTFLDIFQDPENAYEKQLYLSTSAFVHCESYIEFSYGKEAISNFKYKELDNQIINTAKRAKAYWQYNASLSGHSFSGAFSDTPEDCPDEINEILKDYRKVK